MQRDFLQRVIYVRRTAGGGEIMQRRVVLEGLSHRQEGIVAGPLRNVRESGRHVVRSDLLTVPCDSSLVGAQQAGQAEKERGLARSWASDDSYDLAIADVERDITKSRSRGCARTGPGAVNLAKPSDGYRRPHLNSPRLCWRTFAGRWTRRMTVARPLEAMHCEWRETFISRRTSPEINQDENTVQKIAHDAAVGILRFAGGVRGVHVTTRFRGRQLHRGQLRHDTNWR